MDGIVPYVPYAVKQRLLKHMRKCKDAGLRQRYLVVVNLVNGRSASQIAEILGIGRATVYRVAKRFRQQGEWGLLDRREDNGQEKLDEVYLSTLYDVVKSNPQEHGWHRPTWTREMLVKTMHQQTGTTIHAATMSRALRTLGARRGRPRPRVGCPWSKQAKARRIRRIRDVLGNLHRGEVAVYVDEVDIHLNPKIGLDWMVRGQQKEVMTPGQNVKRYLAGALDATTGQLTWVEAEKKDSMLFIMLLHELRKAYPAASKIHVILDNYRIHSSNLTKAVVRYLGGQIVLHFLPPYCPDENKIERLWQDLHAAVTRNHRCPDMAALMRDVRRFMRTRARAAEDDQVEKAA